MPNEIVGMGLSEQEQMLQAQRAELQEKLREKNEELEDRKRSLSIVRENGNAGLIETFGNDVKQVEAEIEGLQQGITALNAHIDQVVAQRQAQAQANMNEAVEQRDALRQLVTTSRQIGSEGSQARQFLAKELEKLQGIAQREATALIDNMVRSYARQSIEERVTDISKRAEGNVAAAINAGEKLPEIEPLAKELDLALKEQRELDQLIKSADGLDKNTAPAQQYLNVMLANAGEGATIDTLIARAGAGIDVPEQLTGLMQQIQLAGGLEAVKAQQYLNVMLANAGEGATIDTLIARAREGIDVPEQLTGLMQQIQLAGGLEAVKAQQYLNVMLANAGEGATIDTLVGSARAKVNYATAALEQQLELRESLWEKSNSDLEVKSAIDALTASAAGGSDARAHSILDQAEAKLNDMSQNGNTAPTTIEDVARSIDARISFARSALANLPSAEDMDARLKLEIDSRIALLRLDDLLSSVENKETTVGDLIKLEEAKVKELDDKLGEYKSEKDFNSELKAAQNLYNRVSTLTEIRDSTTSNDQARQGAKSQLRDVLKSPEIGGVTEESSAEDIWKVAQDRVDVAQKRINERATLESKLKIARDDLNEIHQFIAAIPGEESSQRNADRAGLSLTNRDEMQKLIAEAQEKIKVASDERDQRLKLEKGLKADLEAAQNQKAEINRLRSVANGGVKFSSQDLLNRADARVEQAKQAMIALGLEPDSEVGMDKLDANLSSIMMRTPQEISIGIEELGRRDTLTDIETRVTEIENMFLQLQKFNESVMSPSNIGAVGVSGNPVPIAYGNAVDASVQTQTPIRGISEAKGPRESFAENVRHAYDDVKKIIEFDFKGNDKLKLEELNKIANYFSQNYRAFSGEIAAGDERLTDKVKKLRDFSNGLVTFTDRQLNGGNGQTTLAHRVENASVEITAQNVDVVSRVSDIDAKEHGEVISTAAHQIAQAMAGRQGRAQAEAINAAVQQVELSSAGNYAAYDLLKQNTEYYLSVVERTNSQHAVNPDLYKASIILGKRLDAIYGKGNEAGSTLVPMKGNTSINYEQAAEVYTKVAESYDIANRVIAERITQRVKDGTGKSELTKSDMAERNNILNELIDVNVKQGLYKASGKQGNVYRRLVNSTVENVGRFMQLKQKVDNLDLLIFNNDVSMRGKAEVSPATLYGFTEGNAAIEDLKSFDIRRRYAQSTNPVVKEVVRVYAGVNQPNHRIPFSELNKWVQQTKSNLLQNLNSLPGKIPGNVPGSTSFNALTPGQKVDAIAMHSIITTMYNSAKLGTMVSGSAADIRNFEKFAQNMSRGFVRNMGNESKEIYSNLSKGVLAYHKIDLYNEKHNEVNISLQQNEFDSVAIKIKEANADAYDNFDMYGEIPGEEVLAQQLKSIAEQNSPEKIFADTALNANEYGKDQILMKIEIAMKAELNKLPYGSKRAINLDDASLKMVHEACSKDPTILETYNNEKNGLVIAALASPFDQMQAQAVEQIKRQDPELDNKILNARVTEQIKGQNPELDEETLKARVAEQIKPQAELNNKTLNARVAERLNFTNALSAKDQKVMLQGTKAQLNLRKAVEENKKSKVGLSDEVINKLKMVRVAAEKVTQAEYATLGSKLDLNNPKDQKKLDALMSKKTIANEKRLCKSLMTELNALVPTMKRTELESKVKAFMRAQQKVSDLAKSAAAESKAYIEHIKTNAGINVEKQQAESVKTNAGIDSKEQLKPEKLSRQDQKAINVVKKLLLQYGPDKVFPMIAGESNLKIPQVGESTPQKSVTETDVGGLTADDTSVDVNQSFNSETRTEASADLHGDEIIGKATGGALAE